MVPYFACHAFGATRYSQRVSIPQSFRRPRARTGHTILTILMLTGFAYGVNLSLLLLFTILKHTTPIVTFAVGLLCNSFAMRFNMVGASGIEPLTFAV